MVHENIKTVSSPSAVYAWGGGFVRGVLFAVAFTLVAFLLFACILAYTTVSESLIPLLATITEAAGALFAGFGAAKQRGNHGFLSGILAGLGYMALIWLIASLAGDGFSFGRHSLLMLLFSALGGAVGGVLGVNLKSGRTNKRKR